MPPPRRSLPVRSRAPDSDGRLSGGTVAGDMHRQQATTVEGQVDRHNNGMDALGVTEKNGVSGMEGGMPTTGDGANGDACRREDNILSQEKSRVLVATVANGKQITVKIKLGTKEFLASSQESRPLNDPLVSTRWFCYTCQRTNASTKKRCKNCQSWRGGNRKIAAKAAKKSDSQSNENAEEETAIEPSERDDDQVEEADLSMGARLPKRNRTNLYSSLSPAVIQATAKARAEAYAALPQLASRSNKRKQPYDKKDVYDQSAAVADEKPATVTGGAVSNEFIGNDGNLFYCRTCMGVGEVVCCDGCPNVVHPSCLPPGPSKTSLEDDENPWFCHECWGAGRATKTAKKRRKARERCSDCGQKETKALPCLPCPHKNCNNFFHLVCPSEDGDDAVIEVIPKKSVCTSCKASGSEKNGRYLGYGQRKLRQITEEQHGLLSSGRGRGRGGKGGKNLRRMSSSEERKTRLKDISDGGANTMSGRKRSYSSGFQSPFVEDDDDNDIGPHSLAYVEKPISSTPAFFFFLLNHRSDIEKSLSRTSPLFRGMAKGLARNEKVAQEGARMWIGMGHKERGEWITVSMKDFEQRVVAWKQKEIIEAMIQSMDASERGIVSKNESDLLLESDAHIANSFTRMNQFNTVKSHPVKVSDMKHDNILLLELLNDARFRPLPLIDKTRAKEDLTQEKVRVSVHQFTPQGPVETSLGDECMGCTRGWSHFCPVLKRPLPNSEYRAKLQPPVSSLTATRIGLGLKINLPREEDQILEPSNEGEGDVGVSDICPNYQPRDSFSLSTPSLRLDDTVAFIEIATATTSLHSEIFSSTAGTPHVQHEIDDLSPGKCKASTRGLLPLRGWRKNSLGENRAPNGFDSVSGTSIGREQMRQYKCGGCGDVQSNKFGCYNCQKAQLITQFAKRSYCCSSSVTGDFLKRSSSVNNPNYGDGFLKPVCVMLGRSNLNDINGRKKHRDGLRTIGLSLTRESWTPNVILPPKPKSLPSTGPLRLRNKAASDIGEYAENRHGVSWICVKCSQMNDELKNRCHKCQGWKGGHRESVKSILPRSCTSRVGDLDITHDRHALALKHKDEANELSRKCLVIACCGVLAGMVRRDPMRLFAEPVPEDVEEYHQVIQDPIDFSTMRKKILSSEYKSFGSFIADARRLCINACVFNPADSLYAKTANEMYHLVEIMQDRAKKWLAIIKNSHASSFIANEDGRNEGEASMFKDVKLMWPGAVELLHDGDWLKNLSTSDFTRTRENEIAYYGSLAIRRAAISSKASLVTISSNMSGARQPVVRRTHTQDELLRKLVDDAAALHIGPIELKDEPDWREIKLLELLKRVQKHRIEGRLSSESGCVRCDGVKTSDETNKVVTLLRSNFKRTVDATRTRVAASRLPQSTGLASRNARELNAEKSIVTGAPLECMVSVRGSRVHGWGLFADHSFQKGEVVAEYIGEYVSDAVADLREKLYSEQRMQDYQFRVDGSLVIDATLRGGYARYINHSCTPNCESKIVDGAPPHEHLKRVLIISQRNINASEELTYDYNFPLEMNLDLRIPCNCGSKQCRGFMNWDIPEKSYRHYAKISKAARRGRT